MKNKNETQVLFGFLSLSVCFSELTRIELASSPWQGDILTTIQQLPLPTIGLEPMPTRVWNEHSTTELSRLKLNLKAYVSFKLWH